MCMTVTYRISLGICMLPQRLHTPTAHAVKSTNQPCNPRLSCPAAEFGGATFHLFAGIDHMYGQNISLPHTQYLVYIYHEQHRRLWRAKVRPRIQADIHVACGIKSGRCGQYMYLRKTTCGLGARKRLWS